MRLRDLVVTETSARDRKAALAAAKTATAALRGGVALAGVMQRYNLHDSGVFVNNGKVDMDEIFDFAAEAKLNARLFEALKPLNAGEVSEPVELLDGVHLLYVSTRRRSVAQGFEGAANQVWSDFKSAAQARVNKGNLEYLRKRANILIAPEYASGGANGG